MKAAGVGGARNTHLVQFGQKKKQHLHPDRHGTAPEGSLSQPETSQDGQIFKRGSLKDRRRRAEHSESRPAEEEQQQRVTHTSLGYGFYVRALQRACLFPSCSALSLSA